MKVVAGLGNPGKRYAHTPHNAGFDVVDGLSDSLGFRLKRSFRFRARLGKGTACGGGLLLVEPLTFMNNSGLVVSSVMRYHRAVPDDLVVVLDDADLGLGRIRIRQRGSSGGHRGLDSIIRHVGSSEFVRVRVGIGRQQGGDLVHHVLSPFSAAERERMSRIAARAGEAVLRIVDAGADIAMNEFNGIEVE